MKTAQPLDNRESVLLVGVSLKKSAGRAGEPSFASRDSLEELEELTLIAGGKIAGSICRCAKRSIPRRWWGAASWTKFAPKPNCAMCRW